MLWASPLVFPLSSEEKRYLIKKVILDPQGGAGKKFANRWVKGMNINYLKMPLKLP